MDLVANLGSYCVLPTFHYLRYIVKFYASKINASQLLLEYPGSPTGIEVGAIRRFKTKFTLSKIKEVGWEKLSHPTVIVSFLNGRERVLLEVHCLTVQRKR